MRSNRTLCWCSRPAGSWIIGGRTQTERVLEREHYFPRGRQHFLRRKADTLPNMRKPI
jgi:hypothetical protein